MIQPEIHLVVTIIETYQYPGSLTQLQNILNIAPNTPGIPKESYHCCTCTNPTTPQKTPSIETAIMAFFAQHPQFTNGASINFEQLGLSTSNLKKEYDYLLTLQGFSALDMSTFHINHMYASTINDIVKSTDKIRAMLDDQKRTFQ